MLTPVAVADTSTLAKLFDEDLEHFLEKSFRKVLLPGHVEVELRRRGPSRRAKLRRLLESNVLVRCTDYPEHVVLRWHAVLGQGGRRQKNKGEAEALAQCQSREVDAFLVEERRATELATTAGIRVIRASEIVAHGGELSGS